MTTESEETPQLFTKLTWLIALALVGLFFLFFVIVLPAFVPSESTLWRFTWAVITAGSITGVFFLAVMSFFAVFNDERARARRGV
jgi:hypothetical protein